MKLKQQLTQIQESLSKIECILFGRRDPQSFHSHLRNKIIGNQIGNALSAGATRRPRARLTRRRFSIELDGNLLDRVAIIAVKHGISQALLIETLLKRCIDAIDTQPDIIAATQEIERRLKNT